MSARAFRTLKGFLILPSLVRYLADWRMRKGLLAYDVSVTAIAWCAEEVKNTERFPEMDSMGDWSLREPVHMVQLLAGHGPT